MISSDDDQLSWDVSGPDDKGMVTVVVRHPIAQPFIGWAYRKDVDEAKDKALARLNYANDGYGYAKRR